MALYMRMRGTAAPAATGKRLGGVVVVPGFIPCCLICRLVTWRSRNSFGKALWGQGTFSDYITTSSLVLSFESVSLSQIRWCASILTFLCSLVFPQNSDRLRNHLEALWKTDCGLHPQNFWINRSGWEPPQVPGHLSILKKKKKKKLSN